MGSEMCIRDSSGIDVGLQASGSWRVGPGLEAALSWPSAESLVPSCLLYTSDAADERSSVDLGGRRIIKKKNPSVKEPALVEIHRIGNERCI